MRQLLPQEVKGFSPVLPSSPEFLEAWATAFTVGCHQYGLRIEAAWLEALGLDGFPREQGLPVPAGGKGYFLKFDNAINEQDPKRAFGRLPPPQRLTITEMQELASKLAGGIETFCHDHAPDFLIGVPNDAKLELWYHHLCRRSRFAGHSLDVRSTAYHSHRVLLIQRL